MRSVWRLLPLVVSSLGVAQHSLKDFALSCAAKYHSSGPRPEEAAEEIALLLGFLVTQREPLALPNTEALMRQMNAICPWDGRLTVALNHHILSEEEVLTLEAMRQSRLEGATRPPLGLMPPRGEPPATTKPSVRTRGRRAFRSPYLELINERLKGIWLGLMDSPERRWAGHFLASALDDARRRGHEWEPRETEQSFDELLEKTLAQWTAKGSLPPGALETLEAVLRGTKQDGPALYLTRLSLPPI